MKLARLVFAAWLAACAPSPNVVLVESVPLETDLGRADVPRASDVWLEMIRGARHTIDLAEFYVSDQPGSHLHAVLEEIEQAADRGVHVRLLCDQLFYAKYPEIPDAWAKRPHMEVHRIDLAPGVMHAKYFIVDRREAYLGSQNFDWRSLDHIFEIGARVGDDEIVRGLESVFEADWSGAPIDESATAGALSLVASPQNRTPASVWDLPRLVDRIQHAKTSIHVEVLTYKTKDRDGSEFHDLDDALRSAAKRGVHVELLVSTWGEKDDAVVALAKTPAVTVRVLAIPAFSGGDIEFARVAHAKYAVFDGARCWIGTSNWEGDYFRHSRNVGLLDEGPVCGRLDGIFDGAWNSRYARPLASPP